MDFYPNVYFDANHFQRALLDLQQIVNQFANPDLKVVQRHGYSVYAVELTRLTRELTEISVCLDSLRPDMSYKSLANISGLSVSEVQTILKHKRPKVS